MGEPRDQEAIDEAAAEGREAERRARHERLAEEALDAAAYQRALESQGFTRREALELVMHWQGWRWNDGAP